MYGISARNLPVKTVLYNTHVLKIRMMYLKRYMVLIDCGQESFEWLAKVLIRDEIDVYEAYDCYNRHEWIYRQSVEISVRVRFTELLGSLLLRTIRHGSILRNATYKYVSLIKEAICAAQFQPCQSRPKRANGRIDISFDKSLRLKDTDPKIWPGHAHDLIIVWVR